MKFSRKLHCDSSSAYHSTAFIKHNKIYLPPPRARTPPLPPALGGDTACACSCAPVDPAGAGAAGAGAGSSAGSIGGGPPAHGAFWECEIMPGLSVPSLLSLLPRPAPPRSTPRRSEVEFSAKTAFRKVDAHDFLAATAHLSH